MDEMSPLTVRFMETDVETPTQRGTRRDMHHTSTSHHAGILGCAGYHDFRSILLGVLTIQGKDDSCPGRGFFRFAHLQLCILSYTYVKPTVFVTLPLTPHVLDGSRFSTPPFLSVVNPKPFIFRTICFPDTSYFLIYHFFDFHVCCY